jgi:Plasmid pRiA4b ORF-3-like protein
MTSPTTPLSIYQLRIVLRGSSPLIGRRVLVSSKTTLTHFHAILQIVFAWSDEHLHSCHIHGKEYGSSGAPTRGVRLRDCCLHRGERFRYVYDFGAHWECDSRLEALLPRTARQVYPVCTGDKRAAPPEGCWGAWGSLERLDHHRLYPPPSVREALGELDEFREAVDCLEAYQQFQPDQFDRREINTQLHAVVWAGEEGP